MKFKDCYILIKSDLSQLGVFKNKNINLLNIFKGYIGSKSAQASILFRLANYFGYKNNILGCLIANHSVKITGCDIKHKANIGQGLRVCHTVGVVISDEANIGDNCWIYQNVTIGKKNNETVNNIGNNVRILSGAKVFAENIGNNVIIGANSVVIHDIPDNCVVAGIPAKIIKKSK